MGDRFEWVEIIEPSRHEHMFANLKTGQCLWDPPDGVTVKPTHENQWWELYDTNTGRYYYYNATSQETVWRKPKDGDIIPLSKLQMLKSRETSNRDSTCSSKIRNDNSFDNNNMENMKHEPIKLNESQLSTHTKEKQSAGNKDNVIIKNQETNPSLKNVNNQALPVSSSTNKSSTQSASVYKESPVLNGKHSTLPRTLTVGPNLTRPAVKDKPKYSSLRSKAPPKPPRIMVNVIDTRNSNTINISVEKTENYNDTSVDTQKENFVPSISDESVKKSQKTARKLIEKPKGPAPPAPIAILPPAAPTSSQDDNIMTITTRNSISDDKCSSEQYPSSSSKQQIEYASPLDVIPLRGSTFSSFTPKDNTLQSTNISQTDEYAVPIKISNSKSFSQQAEYDVPMKIISKPIEEPVYRPTSALSSKYDSPLQITSDTETKQVVPSTVDSVSHCSSSFDGVEISLTNNISTEHGHPDPVLIPSTSDICTYGNIEERVFTDLKPAPVPNDYALISEIDSINEKNTSGVVSQAPPVFPINVVPCAPPPPKITPRRQLPSMYDNVNPGTLSMYDNSSENEEFNDTFISADGSTSPRACNMSGSSDEAFDPSASNLLGSESPDGNYYDRIDGMERRSCATLPSPRASPRKLPKVPSQDDRGTPPAKRNPLVRMKSDPLVDVEKRAKISKTIESIQSTFRPISMLNLSNNIANITHKHKRSVLGSESDIPEQVPLSTHRTGILRRRMSIHSMLSWSKSCIKKPMVLTRDKSQRKDAVDVFKLILICMGDKSTRKNHENIIVDIVTKGWTTPQLRDEIYIQLCKQTTGNKKVSSLKQGWELITACLSIFPPSNKFHSYLEGYISRHLDCEDEIIIQANVPMYAKYCYKQLERICQTGAKRGLKGPTIEVIHAAIKRVFNPSMFGNTLEDVMEMQKDRFPDLRLPWILTTLTESVLLQNGLKTEGIFRVPGDIDDVNQLKLMIDQWQTPEQKSEPTVAASLLKLWFRDLYEPLIPQRFYDQCIHNCDNPEISLNIIHSLPPLNKLIFSYLIRLLQAFVIPENVAKSKMDENNLAMVWAPNCLRCPSDDPREIFENTRKEMTFLRNVLKVLDTSFLEGVV